jgi:hypothetical protein
MHASQRTSARTSGGYVVGEASHPTVTSDACTASRIAGSLLAPEIWNESNNDTSSFSLVSRNESVAKSAGIANINPPGRRR